MEAACAWCTGSLPVDRFPYTVQARGETRRLCSALCLRRWAERERSYERRVPLVKIAPGARGRAGSER
jgi:hypothetical protein